ncbi:MAG: polyhydroxyalkanoate synthesis regulator DNA-binding domain-containing protein [Desulfobacterales bacterium]
MNKTVVLKKYANRRLYDTEKSAYVTLEQVSEMIREGRGIQVLDAKTKEDVTAFVLTQIILEQAKNRDLLLPVPVLQMIIRYGDNVLNDFFDRYLQPILQNYMTHKNAFDRHFQQWVGMGADFTEMARRAASGFGPFSPFFGGGAESQADGSEGGGEKSERGKKEKDPNR